MGNSSFFVAPGQSGIVLDEAVVGGPIFQYSVEDSDHSTEEELEADGDNESDSQTLVQESVTATSSKYLVFIVKECHFVNKHLHYLGQQEIKNIEAEIADVEEEKHIEESEPETEPEHNPVIAKEPDSESNTSFYSVNSDPEPAALASLNKVRFGNSFEEEQNMSPPTSKKSPLKKLKKFFAGNSSKEYELAKGMEITTAYVDLPRVSVNPLFDDDFGDEIMETNVNSGVILEAQEPLIIQTETRYVGLCFHNQNLFREPVFHLQLQEKGSKKD